MSPDTLQTLGILAIWLGFLLIGLGGFSTYHASQQLQHAAELRELQQKGEMNAQLLSLLQKNQDLLETPPPQASAPAVAEPPPVAYYRPPSPPPPTFNRPETGAEGGPETAPQEPAAPEMPAEPPATGGAPPQVALDPLEPPARSSDWDEPDTLQPEPSGRYLTGRQRNVIADTLRAHGRHLVTIESSYGDPTSKAFAEELAAAFSEADWVVRGIEPHHGLPLASGVTVSAASFPPLPETRAVYEALLSAGIAVTQQLDPKQHTSETVVMVGAPL